MTAFLFLLLHLEQDSLCELFTQYLQFLGPSVCFTLLALEFLQVLCGGGACSPSFVYGECFILLVVFVVILVLREKFADRWHASHGQGKFRIF